MSTVFANPILFQLVQAPGPVEAAGIFADAAPQFEAAREAADVVLAAMEGVHPEDALRFAEKVAGLKDARDLVQASGALAGVSTFVGEGISPKQWRDLTGTETWLKRRAALFHDFSALVKGMKANLGNGNAAAIVQRTTELLALGVPNATAVAQVEAAMGFKLNLDPKAIQAKADELKKIFQEVIIRVPKAYYDLTGNEQRALKLIGRAMRYLEVPHRRQVNPFGEVFETLVMETPVLEPLRPFYRRWAGPYDMTRSRLDENGKKLYFGFLPGMEAATRYAGGGMYPFNLTVDAFREEIPEGSPLDKEMRLLFAMGEGGKLKAVPYSQAYAQWLEPAAQLLEEAAGLLKKTLPEMADYLRTTASAYRTNDFESVDRAWVQLEARVLDMDLAPVEQYADKLRHALAQFGAYVQIRDTSADRELSELKNLFPELEGRLPVAEPYKLPADNRIPPPLSVVWTLFGTADCNVGEIVARAYNQPNHPEVRRELGKRIVLMENIGRVRDESEEMTALVRLAVHPDQHHLYSARGVQHWVRLHELAHGHGVEHVLGRPDFSSIQALGKIFGSLEELKADFGGMHDAAELVQMGHFSERLLHEIYVGYVARCFISLRKGWAEDHVRGNIFALNFLQQEGAVQIDPQSGVARVDFEKMGPAVSKLAGLLITIKGDGDRQKAEQLYAEYGTRPPQGVTNVLEKMKDVPLDSIFRYAFSDLLADHPQ
ncbi:MAG: hypothetical protein HY609_06270 [Deltaproteobacteria bacterium]|nr:hypothetical protein [Deltaproteobacteria bacterium]